MGDSHRTFGGCTVCCACAVLKEAVLDLFPPMGPQQLLCSHTQDDSDLYSVQKPR